MSSPASMAELALQDYETQLMQLEQHNRARMLMVIQQQERNYDYLEEPPSSAQALIESMPDAHTAALHLDHVLQTSSSRGAAENKWLELHMIEGKDDVFLERPSWAWTSAYHRHLDFCQKTRVADDSKHSQRLLSEASFVVRKYYRHHCQPKQPVHIPTSNTIPQAPAARLPIPAKETIEIRSDEVATALKQFLQRQPNFTTDFPNWDFAAPLESPFLFWYQYGSQPLPESTSQRQAELLRPLFSWLASSYGAVHTEIAAKLARGVVSRSTMQFLFRPGQALVDVAAEGTQGYISTSWPRWRSRSTPECVSIRDEWEVTAWSYAFRPGGFDPVQVRLRIFLDAPDGGSEFDASTLDIRPVSFVSGDMQAKLRFRGANLWKVRNGGYYEYQIDARHDLNLQRGRCLIDIDEYSRLTPPSGEPALGVPRPRSMQPSDDHLLVFPNKIPVYDLCRETWEQVAPEDIREVVFVESPSTKSALSRQKWQVLEQRMAPDRDREAGSKPLVSLFHGPPGTGKTFTASMISELLRRPLFRVACRDMAINLETVRTRLDPIFALAKKWNGMVLLEDADHLVQQQYESPSDQGQKDRLGLVFYLLRLFQNFNGVVIVTTSCVEAFDEKLKTEAFFNLKFHGLDGAGCRTVCLNLIDVLMQRWLGRAGAGAAAVKRKFGEETRVAGKAAGANDAAIRSAWLTAAQPLERMGMNAWEITRAFETALRLAGSERTNPLPAHLTQTHCAATDSHRSWRTLSADALVLAQKVKAK
ncbi:uncharacterized protein PpBr36_10524, partial [Pyricularia pennisetigena]|uniref:uncharacterized protein n=1 Tax=Pyricularia pennisetigena TaxID=1578925 RepID=UPI0011507284